jgi:hypothetical protein
VQPTSKLGIKELWKKAQKKATKNNNSDVINKIIPQRKPAITLDVWKPIKVASRVTSRHQAYITSNIRANPTDIM